MKGFVIGVLVAWAPSPFSPPWLATGPTEVAGPPVPVQHHNPYPPKVQHRRPRGRPRRIAPRLVAVREALKQVGVWYRWGGSSPMGFDCSGLVRYAYAKAGVWLPRTTYGQIKAGRQITSLAHARRGDIVFPSYGHEQLYLGHGRVVEAAHSGTRVRVRPVRRYYLAIRRPA